MTRIKHNVHRPALLAVVLLVFGLVPLALAQPADPGHRPEHAGPPQDVVDHLLDRGFRQIQPSIFEREVEAGFSYETVVYGIDGHVWLLGQQEAFLETLQARYDAFPAVELFDAILVQERWIEETRTRLEEMREAEAGNTSGASRSERLSSIRLGADEVISIADATTCTTTLSRSGNAGPSSTGPTASGSASFNDNCTETGSVRAYATAQGVDSSGNTVTYTDDCPSKNGKNVSCSSSASVNAVSNCYSNGQGLVTFGSITYTVIRSNTICRPPTPPTVVLTGDTYIEVYPYLPVPTGSWSASVSGGTPPYNYQWFFNNAPVGTNSSSYSRSFLHLGYATTVNYSVKVTVTDSSSPSQMDTDTLSVQVVYKPDCIEPLLAASTYGEPAQLPIDPCLEP